MKLDRRGFIGLLGSTAVFATGKSLLANNWADNNLAVSNLSDKNDVQDSVFKSASNYKHFISDKLHRNRLRVMPPGLNKGDKVAFTAPASPVSSWNIANGVKYFKSMGCEIVIGDTIKNQKNTDRYLSAPDNFRMNEFMGFIKDPGIKAIICARGGYGVMRILDRIDYSIIEKNPKIIMGFSDITALLNAINERTGITTFHGPVGTSTFDKYTMESLKSVLFESETFDPKTSKFSDALTMNKGRAIGRLVGGNLSMVTSTLGSKYEIDTKDSILFLEEVSEQAYSIDRMLCQLRLAGKFDQCNGFIFGEFKALNSRKPFYPNKGFSIAEVIEQIIKPYGKPVMIGLPFGHVKSKLTLPIGVYAEMDITGKSLVMLEPSVH